MGSNTREEELGDWIKDISQYNGPISFKMHVAIEREIKDFWAVDRMVCFEGDREISILLPHSIRVQILSLYLFADLF